MVVTVLSLQRWLINMALLGEVQEGDMSMVESRFHFPPFSHILYKPHLNKTKIIIVIKTYDIVLHDGVT